MEGMTCECHHHLGPLLACIATFLATHHGPKFKKVISDFVKDYNVKKRTRDFLGLD